MSKNELSEINVKLFGVKGDGITDDTQAFKEALDYFKSTNVETNTLYIPKGEYVISDTLHLHSVVCLKGDGRK